MFHGKHITVSSLLAAVAWIVGGVVVIIGYMAQKEGVPSIGLYIAGWGGVITMARCYERHAVAREKAAFDLGREVGCREQTEHSGEVRRLY